MAETDLDYPELLRHALVGVVKEVLDLVAADGLPGEHQLYITFDTRHPEVEIPMALSQRYPEEMSVVLQHQFWDLDVGEDAFAVTLAFGRQRHRVLVPWDALRTFVDPPAEFGLRFDGPQKGEPEKGEPEKGKAAPSGSETADAAASEAEGEVVSLDEFRKR